MAKHKKRTSKHRTPIEEADVGVAKAAAEYRETPLVRIVGKVSELADQPPLATLCVATIGWGLIAGKPRVTRAGVRMLAAHALSTGIKSVIKKSVDRTRPALLIEEDRYELARGEDSDDHDRTSFPSGHTAGAVAVANAWCREFPDHRPIAYALAGGAAAVQVPRGAHFPTDVAAGAVIGIAAEATVDAAIALLRSSPALHSEDGTR